MKNPSQPLHWPEDFPPCPGLRAAFHGFDWPGPDVSFFPQLAAQQAQRTPEMMHVWQDPELEACALMFGESLCRQLGWRSPYFLPGDSLFTVLYGPKFRNAYDIRIEPVARDFEKQMGRSLLPALWRSMSSEEITPEDNGRLLSGAILAIVEHVSGNDLTEDSPPDPLSFLHRIQQRTRAPFSTIYAHQ